METNLMLIQILNTKKVHLKTARENVKRQKKENDRCYEIAHIQRRVYTDAEDYVYRLGKDIELLERLINEYS